MSIEISTYKTIKCKIFSDRFEKIREIKTSEKDFFTDVGNAMSELINYDQIKHIVISKIK